MTDHVSLEDLSAYIDGELSSAAGARVDAHLASCAACRAEHESLLWGVQFARSLPRRPLPPGARLRIPVPEAPEQARHWWASAWSAAAVGIVAAVAILAVGLSVMGGRGLEGAIAGRLAMRPPLLEAETDANGARRAADATVARAPAAAALGTPLAETQFTGRMRAAPTVEAGEPTVDDAEREGAMPAAAAQDEVALSGAGAAHEATVATAAEEADLARQSEWREWAVRSGGEPGTQSASAADEAPVPAESAAGEAATRSDAQLAEPLVAQAGRPTPLAATRSITMARRADETGGAPGGPVVGRSPVGRALGPTSGVPAPRATSGVPALKPTPGAAGAAQELPQPAGAAPSGWPLAPGTVALLLVAAAAALALLRARRR